MCWSEGTSLPTGRSRVSFSILGNGSLLCKPGNLDGDYIARSEEFLCRRRGDSPLSYDKNIDHASTSSGRRRNGKGSEERNIE